MDVEEKLGILAGAAKYDASCASSGSGAAKGSNGKGALGGKKFGASLPTGICHSWTEDGRCVSLLRCCFPMFAAMTAPIASIALRRMLPVVRLPCRNWLI